MTTVLVRSDANYDHPVQQMIRAWVEPPEHVHHMTHDLAGFLEGSAEWGQTPFAADEAKLATDDERGLTPAADERGPTP